MEAGERKRQWTADSFYTVISPAWFTFLQSLPAHPSNTDACQPASLLGEIDSKENLVTYTHANELLIMSPWQCFYCYSRCQSSLMTFYCFFLALSPATTELPTEAVNSPCGRQESSLRQKQWRNLLENPFSSSLAWEGRTQIQLQSWAKEVLSGMWVAWATKGWLFCHSHSFQAAYEDWKQEMWCREGEKYCSWVEMTFLKSSRFFPYAITFLLAVGTAAVVPEWQDLNLFTLLWDQGWLCSAS